jgi:transposase
VFIDGTGAPMVASETAGRAGKSPDGRSHTREVKIGRFSTQTRTDHHGHLVLDPDSTSYTATFDPAHQFGARLAAEALRRDFAHAPRLAVVGDGAPWIWSLADQLWPQARHIVDSYHACHHAVDLANLLTPLLGPRRDEFA